MLGKGNHDKIGNPDKNPKEPIEEGFCATQKQLKKKCRHHISDAFLDLSKDELLDKLKVATNIECIVKIFANIADKYGVEAIIGLIPGFGDAGPAIVSTLFLYYMGKKAGLQNKDLKEIIKYQVKDTIFGLVPVVDLFVDFFYKSNIKSLKIFQEYSEELIELLKAKGASEEEIQEIRKKIGGFFSRVIKYLISKKKEEKTKR